MIDLFVADLDDASVDEARYCEVLDDSERARIDRTIVPVIRRRRALGRAAQRRLLGARLGVDPRALAFDYGEVGKPSLRSHALAFNVSDSAGSWVCVVGGDVALGVDVELTRDRVDIDGVGRRVYVDRELAQIAALPADARRAAFYRLWTLKESYMKAVGLGFHLEPTSFEFDGFSSVELHPRLIASTRRSIDVDVATSALLSPRERVTIAVTRMSPEPLVCVVTPLRL
ncbi:MAG: 4'-phosphopantetheinyl transferase family protein, partial [Polyangiales bacterium]